MATPYLQPRADVEKLQSIVSVLKVKDLVSICAANGLGKSGIKVELQNRILHRITVLAKSTDALSFQALYRSIVRTANPNDEALQPPLVPQYYAQPAQDLAAPALMVNGPLVANSVPRSPFMPANGHGFAMPPAQRPQPPPPTLGLRLPFQMAQSHGQATFGLNFRQSPFYRIESRLGDVKMCEAMMQHRNSVAVSIKLSAYPDLQRCLNDTGLRVMVFCAASNTGIQDVTFPHQCELKVNGGEVKANLRGIKNRPGSTRPVDITDLLRLKPPTYSNNLEFTYALTNKEGYRASKQPAHKFYLALYICRAQSVSALVAKINAGLRISKAAVIQELTQQAQDPEIQATSQVLSLKCPLSYMRLGIPVRATSCKHIQCFDATSYLQLQEQGPQWVCPICNQPAAFANLAVDEYVKDILANTPAQQDQVTIEPDGRWHAPGLEGETIETSRESHDDASYIDDDDDALIISDISFVGVDRSCVTPGQAAPGMGTPTTIGSYGSHSIPRASSSSGKRPISQVIDLTLSDDDEPPDPAPKRQNFGPPSTYMNMARSRPA